MEKRETSIFRYHALCTITLSLSHFSVTCDFFVRCASAKLATVAAGRRRRKHQFLSMDQIDKRWRAPAAAPACRPLFRRLQYMYWYVQYLLQPYQEEVQTINYSMQLLLVIARHSNRYRIPCYSHCEVQSQSSRFGALVFR